jgi:hypothetical protein
MQREIAKDLLELVERLETCTTDSRPMNASLVQNLTRLAELLLRAEDRTLRRPPNGAKVVFFRPPETRVRALSAQKGTALTRGLRRCDRARLRAPGGRPR